MTTDTNVNPNGTEPPYVPDEPSAPQPADQVSAETVAFVEPSPEDDEQPDKV